jgi:hypothetical protein
MGPDHLVVIHCFYSVINTPAHSVYIDKSTNANCHRMPSGSNRGRLLMCYASCLYLAVSQCVLHTHSRSETVVNPTRDNKRESHEETPCYTIQYIVTIYPIPMSITSPYTSIQSTTVDLLSLMQYNNKFQIHLNL